MSPNFFPLCKMSDLRGGDSRGRFQEVNSGFSAKLSPHEEQSAQTTAEQQQITRVRRNYPFADSSEAKRLCLQKVGFFYQNGKPVNDNSKAVHTYNWCTTLAKNLPAATFSENGMAFTVSDLNNLKSRGATTRAEAELLHGPAREAFLGIQKQLVAQDTQLRELRDRVTELKSQLSAAIPDMQGSQGKRHIETLGGTATPLRYSNNTVRIAIQIVDGLFGLKVS